MESRHRSILLPVLLLGFFFAACGGDSVTLPDGYDDLESPLLVASADAGDLESEWEQLSGFAADLEQVGEGVGTIPGFEPFNDPRIVLSDGRLVVRGRWDGDQAMAGWYQRNPALVPEGDENPVVANSQRPVRLFVYDPDTEELRPLSGIPPVRPYSTAVTVGESPDAVLGVMVLVGEQVVAYTSGFSGAAYDLPADVYVAPIPQR